MRKIKEYKSFGIYQASAKEMERDGLTSEYFVFLPGESPGMMDSAEFDCDSIKECMENIDSY